MATKPTENTAKFETLSRGVQYRVEGDYLFLSIPVSKAALAAAPASGSGKSRVVATTNGNITVPGVPNLKLGINAYVPLVS